MRFPRATRLLAFVALSTVPEIEVKILATALALGIAIDALVVRAVLTPAVVTLLGRASWWMPPSPVQEPVEVPAAVQPVAVERAPVAVGVLPGSPSVPGDVRVGLDDRPAPRPAEDGCVIVGQVSGGDRGPARAVLTLIDLHGRQIARVRTDTAGGYRLQFPARGTYLLVCTPDAGTGCGPMAKQVTVVDGPLTCMSDSRLNRHQSARKVPSCRV